MQNFLSDPVAVGMAILGVVLFVGSYAIEWQRAWDEEYEKKEAAADWTFKKSA